MSPLIRRPLAHTIPAMPLPRIAIVGRPNVGKSSLMNLLARERVSIVDPTPGVTRDRVTAVVELPDPLREGNDRLAEITDTGGYGVYTAEGARFDDAGEDLSALTGEIEAQIGAALAQADLVLFVIDAQAGITALDETIATLIRQHAMAGDDSTHESQIVVVANKVDDQHWEPYALEAANLGFGEPLLVSAKTKFSRRSFVESLYHLVPRTADSTRDELSDMKLALVGRRNAGKSSFVNTLAGQQRCIVSEIAGTTRDAIDVRFQIDGRTCTAIDTAGVRKRTKFADAVEVWAFHRCQLAISRADVVLLLIDATQHVTGIDKRLGKQIADEFKPCVIVVSKWDLAEGRKTPRGEIVTPEHYREYIEKQLPGLGHCPIVFSSSKEEYGLRESVEVAFELFDQASQRVPTSKLNDVFRQILAERGPTSRLGTEAKILYASQVTTRPPTIVVVVNKPELFEGAYERYLLNRLRELTPFDEVPVRLLFRERKRADLSDMKRRGRARSHSHGLVDEEGNPIEI